MRRRRVPRVWTRNTHAISGPGRQPVHTGRRGLSPFMAAIRRWPDGPRRRRLPLCRPWRGGPSRIVKGTVCPQGTHYRNPCRGTQPRSLYSHPLIESRGFRFAQAKSSRIAGPRRDPRLALRPRPHLRRSPGFGSCRAMNAAFRGDGTRVAENIGRCGAAARIRLRFPG